MQDDGARFENLVAGHLLKWVHYQQDYEGRDISLVYFRDVDRREIDFIITDKGLPVRAIECKLRHKEVSRSLKYFQSKFPETEVIQVHQFGDQEYVSINGIRVMNWKRFLREYI